MQKRPKLSDVPPDATIREAIYETRLVGHDLRCHIDRSEPDLDWVQRARAVTRAVIIAVPIVLIALGVYVAAASS